MRKNVSSGAMWEETVGYSRAVVIDGRVEVSGTVAVDPSGNLIGQGDAFKQTHYILEKIEGILVGEGFAMADVIRTRMFVTDISHWKDIGRAHAMFFKDVKPATSMVEVSALIGDGMLVEIEVVALKSENVY